MFVHFYEQNDRLSYIRKQGISKSKEIGLLHDPNELLLVDLPVAVAVCLVDHLLQLFISHRLSQLTGHSLQILQRNFGAGVVIEKPERLKNLFPWVSLRDLASHQLHEIRKLNDSLSLTIHLSDHLLHLLFLRLKPKSPHGHLKLLCVDISYITKKVPTPSVSKRSKAYLISCFCSSVSSFLAFLVGLRGAFSFLKVDIIKFK